MRIDRLTVRNFKGFADREFSFNPHFNLLVGDNASGKTSVIEAVRIAIGAWFLGMQGRQKAPGIKPNQVRSRAFRHLDGWNFEKQFPAVIEVKGAVSGQSISWGRDLLRDDGRTTSANARLIADIARNRLMGVRAGEEITLPLICSYGTERLWFEHGQRKEQAVRDLPSRLDGYGDCLESEIQETDLIEWIRKQATITGPAGRVPAALRVVLKAVQDCVERSESVYYDGRYSDLVVCWSDREPRLLKHLSDGQAIMLTLVADIARRAATLNPHLGTSVLTETPGVVLIDELDLHLHPKWQRRVIHDLKRTFPRVQFIATSHSPQLVGETPSSEVMVLEENWAGSPPRSFGIDSSRVLEEVMGARPRNQDVEKLLAQLFQAIDGEDFVSARSLLTAAESQLGPDDPEVTRAGALMTFLEAPV